MIKTTTCETCNNIVEFTSDKVYAEDNYYKYDCECGGVITLNMVKTRLGYLPKP